MRIGNGYDVHRLVENRKLILGGVEIPYEKGLLGHSDADVLLHAVMDALLGAATLGDIGKHFPDNDPAYEGADSMKLLEEVGKGLTAVSAGQGWMRHWTITMSRPWKMTFPKSNRTMNKVMVLLLITWSKSPVRVACSCRRWHRRRTRKRRNACGERRSAGKEGVCEPYV